MANTGINLIVIFFFLNIQKIHIFSIEFVSMKFFTIGLF